MPQDEKTTDESTETVTINKPKPETKPRQRRVWWQGLGVWSARILLLFSGTTAFVLSVLPWGRSLARALLVLPALVTASEPAILAANGGPVRHTQMTIQSESGPVYLDIYAPATPDPLLPQARNGILIVPGVGDNRTFGQLVNLSTSLARSGAIVMNVTTPTLISYDISATDTDATVKAFQKLLNWPGMQGRHVGMVSFSAGVTLTTLAAADPRIRDRVDYVTAFGGYFNARDLLYAFGTRSIKLDGKSETWTPIDVPLYVLGNMTTKDLTLSEQELIKAAILPNGTPLTSTQLAHMSTGAQAIYHILKGDQPTQVTANLKALPTPLLDLLDSISPSRVIANVKAPVYLLHDRHDASLPVTESRAFSARLNQLQHPHEYVEFNIFDHVQVKSGLDTWQLASDGTQLLHVLMQVLD